jgi:hypothetical protein
MPAKKKAPKLNWRDRAELALVSAVAAIRENEDLRRRLAQSEEALKKATEPDPDALNMAEYAEDLRQRLVAEKRELEFWVEESDRFRNQVVELLRGQAQRARLEEPQ